MNEIHDDLTAPIVEHEDGAQLQQTPVRTGTEVAGGQAELETRLTSLQEKLKRIAEPEDQPQRDDVFDMLLAHARPLEQTPPKPAESQPDDHENEIRKLVFRWGARDSYAYRANLLVAEYTAHRILMVKRETLDRIQDAIGYAEISILFYTIGTALGVGFRTTNPAFEVY